MALLQRAPSPGPLPPPLAHLPGCMATGPCECMAMGCVCTRSSCENGRCCLTPSPPVPSRPLASPSFRPPDDLYNGCPSSRSLSALILPLRATAEGTKGPGPAAIICEATLGLLGEAAKMGSSRGPLCRAEGEWRDQPQAHQ
jgi:hypothetical protein